MKRDWMNKFGDGLGKLLILLLVFVVGVQVGKWDTNHPPVKVKTKTVWIVREVVKPNPQPYSGLPALPGLDYPKR